MLAHRVIQTFLIRGETLVKGKQFNSWRSVGHPMQALKIAQARGVDEIVLLDIGATPEGRGPNLKLIEKLTAQCFVPITVGGGVRSVQDVRDLLSAGADKVAIRTNTEVILDAALKFGRQAIVRAIDVADSITMDFEETFAGEVLLTSMDREGTMCGYDIDLVRRASEFFPVPLIAHGGCSGPEDMVRAIRAGASACAAGALFQFTETTPRDCARHLQSNQIEARV